MQPEIYEQLARLEDRHWWHRGRRALVARTLARLELPHCARILDVGCGTGGTTRFLTRFGRVTGLDRSRDALGHAGRVLRDVDGACVLRGDANRLDRTFAPRSFDLVTFFNVLYHDWIEDEVATLRGVREVLAPGGFVLLTEPAFRFLRRDHDRLGMGRTRYRLADFRRFFAGAGLACHVGRYFNALAFPLAVVLAAGDRLAPGRRRAMRVAELALPPRPLNALLEQLMALEGRLPAALAPPFGVSLLVVGRRTQ